MPIKIKLINFTWIKLILINPTNFLHTHKIKLINFTWIKLILINPSNFLHTHTKSISCKKKKYRTCQYSFISKQWDSYEPYDHTRPLTSNFSIIQLKKGEAKLLLVIIKPDERKQPFYIFKF